MIECRLVMFEKREKPLFLVLVAASILLFLSGSQAAEKGKGSGALNPGSPDQGLSPHPLVVFIIDFDSFMCLTCLESLLDFYHQLPGAGKGCGVWGVLVFDASLGNQRGNTFTRIIEKKLKGFMQGNRLQFPVVIDRWHLFDGLGKAGSAVIVFDPVKRLVKKYDFPLRPGQVQEIMSLFED